MINHSFLIFGQHIEKILSQNRIIIYFIRLLFRKDRIVFRGEWIVFRRAGNGIFDKQTNRNYDRSFKNSPAVHCFSGQNYVCFKGFDEGCAVLNRERGQY